MSLKDIFSYPFKNWIRPIVLTYVALPFFMLGAFAGLALLHLIGGALLFLGYFLSVISIFYLLFKREWWKAFYTVVFILMTIMIFGLLAG